MMNPFLYYVTYIGILLADSPWIHLLQADSLSKKTVDEKLFFWVAYNMNSAARQKDWGLLQNKSKLFRYLGQIDARRCEHY